MDTKKYIIEIPDNTAWLQWVKVSDKDGHVCFDFKDPEDLTPYTEPDTEQVMEDAFKNGYDAACKDIDVKSKTNAAYRKGLEDMWECARQIVQTDVGEHSAIFGMHYAYDIFTKLTASEAIEKIRQYEESKEKHTWICSEVNEPSVDTTLICSECGYAIKIKPHETPALNFCPKCGDCKKPKEEET